MARRRKRNRKSIKRSSAMHKRASSRTKHSRPAKRKTARRRNVTRRVVRSVRRHPVVPVRRRALARNRRAPKRSGLSSADLARYRSAISRYGAPRRNPSILGRLFGRRRNPDSYASSMKTSMTPVEMVQDSGFTILRGGLGFVSSMLVGGFVSTQVQSEYSPLLGNVLVLAGSEILQAKAPKIGGYLGHGFSVGAGVSCYVSLLNLLVDRGYLTGTPVRYLAPWRPEAYVASLPAADVAALEAAAASDAIAAAGAAAPAEGAAGLGAYVRQAALYGTPVQQAMRHRMKMLEGGMSGGIFDAKTTLGEYDIMDTAPMGTRVQAGLAAYEAYPPSMGATVEQATAGYGMGATVQEAFAGSPRGLREYVSVPLSGYGRGMGSLRDYVNVGDQAPAYWRDTPHGQSILLQIRDAASSITRQRLARGLPVDANFQRQLTSAALQAVSGQERDVSMQAPTPPLTTMAAPFPGQDVLMAGGIGGQPAGLPSAFEAMEEDDAGIFA